MSDDPYSRKVDSLLRTDVTVYLGDYSSDPLRIVCEGQSILFDIDEPITWERARRALNRPSPQGPYPVAKLFSVSVHEIRLGLIKSLATFHIAVECRNGVAHAEIHSTRPTQKLDVPFVLGDDVVTIARAILGAAACVR